MLNKLQSYLNRYGAHLIFLGDERIKPGMLLEVPQWVPPWWPGELGGLPFTRQEGYAWEFTDESESDYPSELFSANYIQQAISDKTDISAKVSLPQFGITVDAAFKHQFSVAIRLTGVKSKGFLKGTSLPDLHTKLLGLSKSNPPRWKWVNNDFLVAEAFHVTEFEASFKGADKIGVEAAYKDGHLQVSGKLEYTAEGEATLRSTGPFSVPLAVRGIRI